MGTSFHKKKIKISRDVIFDEQIFDVPNSIPPHNNDDPLQHLLLNPQKPDESMAEGNSDPQPSDSQEISKVEQASQAPHTVQHCHQETSEGETTEEPKNLKDALSALYGKKRCRMSTILLLITKLGL